MLRSGALASRDMAVAPRFHAGPAGAHAQHQSSRPHAPASLRARQNGNRGSRSRRLCFSRHHRSFARTKSRSTFIRFVSPRASCGATRPRRATRFTSIFGTTTLSQPDPACPICRAIRRPVFAEPWQAQAFALAVKLSEQGYFTWKEWSAALADELKTEPTPRILRALVGGFGTPGDGQGIDGPSGAAGAQGRLGGRLPAHAARKAGGTGRKFTYESEA